MSCGCSSGNLPFHQDIKLVVVGDGAVGKTCMLVTYKTGDFPDEYVPTVFENYLTTVNVNGRTYDIDLWDTAGQDEFERLRPISYIDADVLLLCFAINSPGSLRNIKEKWLPEIQLHAPDVPFMLIALKTDLRKDDKLRESFRKETGLDFLRYDDGSAIARDLKAAGYVECSAKSQENLERIFREAVSAALTYRDSQVSAEGAKGSECVIL